MDGWLLGLLHLRENRKKTLKKGKKRLDGCP